MKVQMQALVAGLVKTHGIGKESKKPYAMYRVLVLNPIKPFGNGDYNREGVGCEQVEVDCDETFYQRYHGHKFPAVYTLDVEQEIRGGKLSPVVVGMSDGK